MTLRDLTSEIEWDRVLYSWYGRALLSKDTLRISKYFLLGSFNNLRTEYSVSSHYLAAPWRVSSIPPVSRPPHGQYPVSSILQLGPTTSAHQPEDTDSASPIIRWFALDFCGDAHSEALSSDGWRWRAASFLLSSLFVCLFLAVYKATVVAETVLPALQPVIWLAGVCLTATILALDQRCACSLRRSDVATMLHIVAHLVLLFGSCSFLFSGASLTPAGAQVRVISRLAPLNSSSA